jgi:hypothetical protein
VRLGDTVGYYARNSFLCFTQILSGLIKNFGMVWTRSSFEGVNNFHTEMEKSA